MNVATIAPMALQFADLPVRPITAEEALRMLDAGVFAEPNRIELLRGVLVEKPVKSGSHEDVKERLTAWLWPVGPTALRFERPLITPDGISMPEPDLAVGERGEPSPHPTTADLVIEVAKTSITLDTTVKPPLYASAGVPDYWVVDVVRRRVIVFRDPTPTGYRAQTAHVAPERLRPLNVDVAPLDLAALFA